MGKTGLPAALFGDVDRVVTAGVAQRSVGAPKLVGRNKLADRAIPASSSFRFAFSIADFNRRLRWPVSAERSGALAGALTGP